MEKAKTATAERVRSLGRAVDTVFGRGVCDGGRVEPRWAGLLLLVSSVSNY